MTRKGSQVQVLHGHQRKALTKRVYHSSSLHDFAFKAVVRSNVDSKLKDTKDGELQKLLTRIDLPTFSGWFLDGCSDCPLSQGPPDGHRRHEMGAYEVKKVLSNGENQPMNFRFRSAF